MVRFITGPYPIALTDISIQWPNNSYQGLVQNATTAALTADLNASIEACGFLLEPPEGTIPMGSRVLLITSTDMCVEANSFAALSDTLYVVYQFPGNTAGHFANQNNGSNISPVPSGGVSLRTLIMTYLPNACGDTVSYDRQQLRNIYGSYGGSSAENDGATVLFTWPGSSEASYVNNGCQAPFIPLALDILTEGGDLPCDGALTLEGSASSGYTSLLWSGGTGVFGDPNEATTTYTVGSEDSGTITLFLCASGACAQTICDSVVFTISGAPQAAIAADGPLAICPGDQLLLTAYGGDAYSWSTGEVSAAIIVDSAGTYEVEVTGACGSDQASVTVTSAPSPQAVITGDTILCTGESTVLTGSGGSLFNWSTGANTPSITVDIPGTYSLTVSGACGSDEASVAVSLTSTVVSATASPSSGAAPLTVTFAAQTDPPATNWEWDLGDGSLSTASAPTEQFGTPGVYEVTLVVIDANGCSGSTSLSITVTDQGPSSVFVPNVFSPNGDGKNDQFRIISTGLASLDVSIFNRWGKEVAAIDQPNGYWSGRANGAEPVVEGTYFYTLVATGTDGRSYKQQGTITVLR